MKTEKQPSHIADILKSTNAFIKQIENGEGLNLPPDKIKEFKTEFKKQNMQVHIDEVKKRMDELRNLSQKMNGKSN